MGSVDNGFGFGCGCLLFAIVVLAILVFGLPVGCAGLYLLGQ